MDNDKAEHLNEFQLRNIKILTYLLKNNAVSDEIVDHLREAELDYFSLMNKIKLLEEKVNIDEKTSLLKFNNDYLVNIVKTASRIYYGMHAIHYKVSFVRFDIDNFHKFNNMYGHSLGDQVLIKVARILKRISRPTDYIIRFGGDEFDVILPATDIEGSVRYVEKIFNRLKKMYFTHENKHVKITMSAGISNMVYEFNDGKSVNNRELKQYYKILQKKADDALYEAKYKGKGAYYIYSPGREEEYTSFRRMYVR